MTNFIPKNSWPKTDRSRQFLLFATRFRELVHPDAQDIYRVHASSSLAKIRELGRCSAEVAARKYPKASLSPIILEVNECLSSDVIIKRIVKKTNLPANQIQFSIDQSVEVISSLVELWLQSLEPKYLELLTEELKASLAQPKFKRKLLICTKLLVSHLIHLGFKREYLRSAVEYHFFSSDIGQCTDARIDRFLSDFSTSEKKYMIAFFGSKEAISVFRESELLKKIDSPAALNRAVGFEAGSEELFGQNSTCMLVKEVFEKDQYSAVERIKLLTSLPESFGIVYPSAENLSLDDFCIVFEEKRKSAQQISRSELSAPVHSFTSQISYSNDMFESFARYLWSVTRNEDHVAFGLLQRSLEASHAARQIGDASSQLVALWSAFEALLPAPAKEEKGVRIVHFVDFITPCITHKYIRGKFRIFLDDVPRHCSAELDKIIGSELSRSERPRALASALIDNDDQTKKIFAAISSSPLLLQRLFSLGKLISDPAKVQSKQEAHEQRVSWQLYRIYRERNLIVHSGAQSEQLPVLVENLFLYYRLVLRALQQMHSQYGIYSPDSALELVKANNIARKEKLSRVIRNGSDRDFRKNFLDTLFID